MKKKGSYEIRAQWDIKPQGNDIQRLKEVDNRRWKMGLQRSGNQ